MKKLKQPPNIQKQKKKPLRGIFDDFISERSAEEIIDDLKKSRNSTRKMEEF